MTSIGKDRELPLEGSSLPLAVYRLETISRAIRKTFNALAAERGDHFGFKIPTAAYVHFRTKAYKLIAHYIDAGLQDAFHWMLAMSGAAPKRKRASVADN